MTDIINPSVSYAFVYGDLLLRVSLMHADDQEWVLNDQNGVITMLPLGSRYEVTFLTALRASQKYLDNNL